MKKVLVANFIVLLLFVFLSPPAMAGGIDNKQNFSVRYLGTGSRNAATDGVDIVAYNPAGIMQQENGFAVSLDAHYIWKDYEHTYNQFLSTQVTRDQDEPSLVPGIFAKYTHDKWGVFGSFTINGGGGEVKYENGNVITNSIEALLVSPAPAGLGAGVAGLISNEWIEAESYYLTYTVGGSYEFNEMFSVAAGIRYIDATKDVEAFGDLAGTVLGDTTVVGAYEEDADGWGWVASFNVKPSKDFLIAVRYESTVELEFETKFDAKTNTVGAAVLGALQKTNGGKLDRDLPAVLGIGLGWDATDRLNLNTSFTYYFEEDADWDGHEDKSSGSWDWGVSFTYGLFKNFRVSLGYLYTDIGYDGNDFDLTAKMSPALSAHTFLGGCGYDFNEYITVNLGFMMNFYEEDGTIGTTTAEYDKQNTSLGLGVEFRF